MISYQTDGVKMPDIKKKETTEWIKEVAACYGKRVGEIAYIFCSDEKILEVNRQYLQHDYYTDIITSIIVKAIVYQVTYSSVWIRYIRMRSSLAPHTKTNYIV